MSLYATGATTLRVRLTTTGPDEVAIAVADPLGAPVAAVESLVMRPITAGRLEAARNRPLYRVDWQPVAAAHDVPHLVPHDVPPQLPRTSWRTSPAMATATATVTVTARTCTRWSTGRWPWYGAGWPRNTTTTPGWCS
ncbi:hypothetical protein NKH77_01415 [Streptomyces sp. M19]